MAAAARKATAARKPTVRTAEITAIDPLKGLRKTGIPGHTLMYEVNATCTVISKGRKTVVFEGWNAYTDNVRIVLPAITSTALYDAAMCLILRGYANHESAHCRLTSWDALKAGLVAAELLDPDKAVALKIKKIYKAVSNILEDCYIERALRAEFPGTLVNLDALRAHSVRKAHERIAEFAGHAPVPSFTNALLCQCNVVNAWSTAGLSAEILDAIAATHPWIGALVAKWAPDILAVRDSKRSHELSLEIVVDFLANLPTQQNPPQESGGNDAGDGDAEGDDEADAGEGPKGDGGGADGKDKGDPEDPADADPSKQEGEDGDPGDDGAGDDADDQDGEDSAQDPEGGGAEPDADAGTTGGDAGGDDRDGSGGPDSEADEDVDGESDGTGDPGEGDDSGDEGSAGGGPGASPSGNGPDQDLPETLDDALGDLGEDIDPSEIDISDIAKDVGDETGTAEKAIKKAFGKEAADSRMEGVETYHHDPAPGSIPPRLPSDPRITRAIRTMAMSTARQRVSRYKEEGEFDPSSILSQALGSGDIYKRVVVKRQVATALAYLVDQSGSMTGIMESVGGITCSAAEASFGIPNLKTAAFSFTSEMKPSGTGANHGYAQKLAFHVLKDFGDTPARARGSLATWRADMGDLGGTPTADAMLEAGRRLDMRREERKIVVLLTDGGPDNLDAARAAQAHLKRRGISVYLIEIGPHARSKMAFEVSIVAKTEEDLPAALEEIARLAFQRPGGA